MPLVLEEVLQVTGCDPRHAAMVPHVVHPTPVPLHLGPMRAQSVPRPVAPGQRTSESIPHPQARNGGLGGRVDADGGRLGQTL